MSGSLETDTKGSTLPVFKIDLSLPPSERYVELAKHYRGQMRSLAGLFDELVVSIHPNIPLRLVHWVARLCLRRLYTVEETEEIRGISRVTGIDMYLLVSFNVLLDLFMGCTSGGVKVKQQGRQTKMVHFRTLDWGMDPLRSLVIQLEYVRSPETDKVLATSITYAGFVGVLTGVKKDLSVSLNFRPVHDPRKSIPYYFNHLLILLGIRRSISSLLRQCILPVPLQRTSFPLWLWPWRKSRGDLSARPPDSLDDVVGRMPETPTTAAYLIFSDGALTVTMEKDYRSAVVRSSSSFIVITNHDQQPDSAPTETVAEDQRRRRTSLGIISSEMQSVADVIDESSERRNCIQTQWDHKVRQHMRGDRRKSDRITGSDHRFDPVRRTRASTRLGGEKSDHHEDGVQDHHRPDNSKSEADVSTYEAEGIAATQREVVQWLSEFPIVNESTHYAVIMDPSEGKIAWVQRYLEPRFVDEN